MQDQINTFKLLWIGDHVQVLTRATYNFDFIPFLTQTYVADGSYMVRLNVRSTSSNLLAPPEAGTLVTTVMSLDKISPSRIRWEDNSFPAYF